MSATYPPLPGKFCPECYSFNYFRYKGDSEYRFACEECGNNGPEEDLAEETIKPENVVHVSPDEVVYRRRKPFPTMGFWFDGTPKRGLELVELLPKRIYRAHVTLEHSARYTKLVIKAKGTPSNLPLWITRPMMIVVRYRSDNDREMGTPFSVNAMEIDVFENTYSLISTVE